MSDRVDIGDVTRGSGLPTSTLHVWERAGLLDPIGRDGLRRQYDAEVFQRLATIVLLQRGGFTLEEIRELLEPDPTG
ncbi:MAG: MerR family transcriptional regulator, partial [Acidimicrobiia bacterium]|nr:MerR family transcriptional regulator [Acidimicrobiia bacterium]